MLDKDKQLLYLFFVVLMSFMGLAIQYPIMAPLFLSSDSCFHFMTCSRELLYGVAMASFPLGQFLGCPVIGTFSDYYGRKKAFKILLIMLSLGYILTIYALTSKNYTLFILSRFFSGFWEGIVALGRATAADLEHKIEKSKSFGYINAASTSGYLLGPFITGLLNVSLHNHSNPEVLFLLSLSFNIAALLVLNYGFKDTERNIIHTDANELKHALREKIKSTFQPLANKTIFYAISMSTLVVISFNAFYKFSPVLLVHKFQACTHDIAVATVIISSSMVFSQLVLSAKINKLISLDKSIVIFGFLISCNIITITLINSYLLTILAYIPLGISIGIIGINIPVFISNMTEKNQQGQIMGLTMSMKYLGDALMTVIGGLIAGYYFTLPLLMASFSITLGVILYVNIVKNLKVQA